MKCCNKEDILYTTRHNELYVRKYVGMEGYLANSTEELMKKIQDDSFISKIKDTVVGSPNDFDWRPLYYTEVISENGKDRYCIFLPKDKVFEYDQFRDCKSVQELYRLIVYYDTNINSDNLNFGVLDLFDYLTGSILHLRDKSTKKEYAVKIRNLNEKKYDDSYSEIFINGKSLYWWFCDYEIFTDKWQPFGVIVQNPKNLKPIEEIYGIKSI